MKESDLNEVRRLNNQFEEAVGAASVKKMKFLF
jgi:hypothetical protein